MFSVLTAPSGPPAVRHVLLPPDFVSDFLHHNQEISNIVSQDERGRYSFEQLDDSNASSNSLSNSTSTIPTLTVKKAKSAKYEYDVLGGDAANADEPDEATRDYSSFSGVVLTAVSADITEKATKKQAPAPAEVLEISNPLAGLEKKMQAVKAPEIEDIGNPHAVTATVHDKCSDSARNPAEMLEISNQLRASSKKYAE
jgi:hypothetical protein